MPINLFGDSLNEYGGLFGSPEELQAANEKARKDAMLAAGLGLLAGGGPSLTPINFGQAFAQAGMAGINARDASAQRSMQAAMIQRQMAERKAAASRPEYTNVPGVGLVKIPPGGDPSVAIETPAGFGDAQTPAAVAEYNFYAGLPKDKQAEFLNVKRASQMFNAGGVPQSLAPSGAATPLSTPQAENEAARAKAAATAIGTAGGEAAGKAQVTLPRMEASVARLSDTIKNIKSHPGFSDLVGQPNWITAPFGKPMRGSNAAGAAALIEQLKGSAFLEAFEQLKGGGAIQEREGEKATAAIARLDTAQSEADYLAALDDLDKLMTGALETARTKAQGGSNAAPAQARRYNPQTGRIE